MRAPRFFPVFSLLILLSFAAAPAAQAELVLRLSSPQAVAGAVVDLEGLLVNDTGNLLASPIPASLSGQWTDAQGRSTPAQFQLRTSANTADLPANTFTRMAWTGTVPSDAKGLVTLTIQGADDTLLALQVGHASDGIQTAAAAPMPLADTSAPVPGPSTAGLSPFETFRNALSPYEPVYFALGRNDGANARFQLSFKYRPFSPADPAHPSFMDNWYIGYTQTSLWDLHSDSIPFIDTTYNPSLFWAQESLWETADKRWSLGVNTGIEHKSNGKDDDDSRSLNDAYLQPEISYRFDGGSRLSFQPRIKAYFATDPDMRYQDYLGYVDWKLRWAQDNGLVLSGLYRRGSGGHATQLEAAWPLQRTFLHMNGHLYVQYFQGYGETLLGYRQKSDPQVRIGIALVP
ncbi:MAG: phospholipase A [Castellaniella sp.]|uniref:phospholipase A n=1 Tax=Castellaniella sp. TaxID=1955812 RepID=UPI003C76DAEE